MVLVAPLLGLADTEQDQDAVSGVDNGMMPSETMACEPESPAAMNFTIPTKMFPIIAAATAMVELPFSPFSAGGRRTRSMGSVGSMGSKRSWMRGESPEPSDGPRSVSLPAFAGRVL